MKITLTTITALRRDQNIGFYFINKMQIAYLSDKWVLFALEHTGHIPQSCHYSSCCPDSYMAFHM